MPSWSNGHEAVNFRKLKESHSLHLEEQVARREGWEGSGADGTDLFGAFSSVTVHYDGDN